MHKVIPLTIKTYGERFYSITSEVKEQLDKINIQSGTLLLFTPHTSCALCINESYDPSACEDMENFLKHLAPRNLHFIKHCDEGADDSPSHMKSILLQPSITFIIEKGKLLLGQWQGIFLCEFRDSPKERTVYLKYQTD